MFKQGWFIKGILFMLLSALLLINNNVQATSLWNDNSESIFTDDKANQVGDLLTIIIKESTTASQQASTDASQSSQANVGAGSGILNFIKAFGVNQSDTNSATGSTSRSGSLDTKITVQIVEILPNGNFKISGKKHITINSEKQEVEMTGIVRPNDINADNTIDSTYVANVSINYEGKGAIGDKQRPGIINRILDWFF
ncbi:flagellar biosynthesis protein FlgH [Orenia metallireducens]|jgi:flagellar L-ring protein precursor FlgH|uniref:Flagellar L-ring protein n=1 Tax=Orenia metallireducens TaxID=1413210 RepID=A0A1C0A665_9FIRM|nr:flagellar basal body L-ring protein FlgH [Orenia metallireducens]OCL25634.1 flagellar biosynthesis protein FlgH [Orenia metallireducens]